MARTTRQDWIEAAWSALAQGGPMEHLRIEQLARSMATSKGSFYWHFQDRAALLEALLQRWEETATAAIVREVEAASKAEALALLWELGRSQEGLGPEVAIRLWARREPAVEHRVRQVDRNRLAFIETLLAAAGVAEDERTARAMGVYALIIADVWLRPGLEGLGYSETVHHAFALAVGHIDLT